MKIKNYLKFLLSFYSIIGYTSPLLAQEKPFSESAIVKYHGELSTFFAADDTAIYCTYLNIVPILSQIT